MIQIKPIDLYVFHPDLNQIHQHPDDDIDAPPGLFLKEKQDFVLDHKCQVIVLLVEKAAGQSENGNIVHCHVVFRVIRLVDLEDILLFGEEVCENSIVCFPVDGAWVFIIYRGLRVLRHIAL